MDRHPIKSDYVAQKGNLKISILQNEWREPRFCGGLQATWPEERTPVLSLASSE